MNDIRAEYERKKQTTEQILRKIRSGDKIFVGFYGGEPRTILRRIHEIGPDVENVEIWKATDMEDYPVFTDPSMEGHIEMKSIFYGKTARKMAKTRPVDYFPNDLHNCMRLKNEQDPCNVFMVTTSPMDQDGYFTLGSWVQVERDALNAADTVILEVNPNVPRTFGDTAIHISEVDWLLETDAPLPEMPEIPFTSVEEAIGENVAELVHDGDCIQLGIGGTSNVVARKLEDKHHLGIHSEMFTNSMMDLMKKGVIDCGRKNLNPGLAVAAFAWGSRELYDFIDGNRDIVFRSSSYVNDPFVIAQNDNMVSINTTLQVDLTGQICSESIGPRLYSGTGGAFDFAYGALHSRGGRGIIAVQSTAKNGTVSRISPMLTEGAMVSITRNAVDNIVTEYGVAPLRGRTVRQRVRNLIAVAHPDFREELKKQAEYLMLW